MNKTRTFSYSFKHIGKKCKTHGRFLGVLFFAPETVNMYLTMYSLSLFLAFILLCTVPVTALYFLVYCFRNLVCSGKITFKNGPPSAGHPITTGMTARLKMSMYEKKGFFFNALVREKVKTSKLSRCCESKYRKSKKEQKIKSLKNLVSCMWVPRASLGARKSFMELKEEIYTFLDQSGPFLKCKFCQLL